MEKKLDTIGFFENQPSGCFWYRIKHPKDALTRHGIKTSFLHINEDIELDDMMSFLVYGVYPFSFGNALSFLKSEKKKIIYDMDDAFDLIELDNPFYYAVKKDARSTHEIFALADVVTVSTPVMKAYVEARSDKPVVIIPNMYEPTEWMFPRPKREGIRIGFAGSSTHIKDLMEVLPSIKKLQEEYKELVFILFGFSSNDYTQWLKDIKRISTDEAIADILKFEEEMKGIRFEWCPFVDFELYPSVLTNMALDIGLCPLRDTPFNRCRSASKAMEYALSGALAVASNVIPYTTEPTSITTDFWYSTLKHYITNPEDRQKELEKHQEWIRENKDINKHIDLLKSVYVN